MPCTSIAMDKHIQGTCCIDFQDRKRRLHVPVHQTAWHHNPKHGNFNEHHYETLPSVNEEILHRPWQYFDENSCRASSTSIELRSVSSEGTKFWSVWVNRRALCRSTSIYSSPTLNTKCCNRFIKYHNTCMIHLVFLFLALIKETLLQYSTCNVSHN